MYLPTEDGKDMVKIELPKYALTSLELAMTSDESFPDLARRFFFL